MAIKSYTGVITLCCSILVNAAPLEPPHKEIKKIAHDTNAPSFFAPSLAATGLGSWSFTEELMHLRHSPSSRARLFSGNTLLRVCGKPVGCAMLGFATVSIAYYPTGSYLYNNYISRGRK